MDQLRHNTVRFRWGHAVALLALFAAVIFYYFDYLTGTGFIWEDMMTWYYPVANYFCTAVAGGRFPFWLPGLLNGVPLYTDFQAAMYYPFRWLLALCVHDNGLSVLAYQHYVVLHLLLGGASMYGYLKSHRLRPLACGLGSLVFCLSGFSALHIIHNPMLKVYAWLPAQLWLVDRAAATRRAKYYAGLTLVIFLSLCAGFPQTTLYDSYLVIAYWFYRRLRVTPVTIRQLAGEGARIAGVFASVLLLGAIMILPTFEHWQMSTRESLGFTDAACQSLPVRNLIQVAVPNFFGTSNCTKEDDNFWGHDPHYINAAISQPGRFHYWCFGVYAGQLSVLALLVVVCSWRTWRATPVRFFVIGWGLAVWFMLGRYGGLFSVLYQWLPGVAMFRSPARMAGVADCCAAVAVAWVIDAGRQRVGKAVAAGLGLYAVAGAIGLAWGTRLYPELHAPALADFSKTQLLLALYLFIGVAGSLLAMQFPRRLWHWVGGGLLAGLTFADLYLAYGFFHQGEVYPQTYYRANHWVVEKYQDLTRRIGPIRFAQLINGRFGQFALDRNLPLLESGFDTPQGEFDLMLKNTALIRQLTNQTALLDLQNVGLTLGWRPGTGLVTGDYRPDCLPRVKFFPAARRYDSDAAILHDLDTGALDYRRTVAVRADELPVEYHDMPVATDAVTFLSDTPEHYQIQYHVSSPGIIFVSESFYPGWVATDEADQPLKLIRTFIAFKGIVITQAGHGVVDVRFRPGSFRLGAMITGGTALALLIFYGWLTRRERRRSPVPVQREFEPVEVA